MTKDQYLAEANVASFVDFLAGVIDGKTRINHAMPNPEYARSKKIPPVFYQSLQDAYRGYWWASYRDGRRITSYEDNAHLLHDISEKLRSALNGANDLDQNRAMLTAIEACMRWGFGTGRLAYNSNMEWAQRQGDHLHARISSGATALQSDAGDLRVFGDDVRMNAGYTKVYSLLLDNLIIYDGRVGAALGMLVRKFCENGGLTVIPEHLHFRWGASQTQRNRNPSCRHFQFKALNQISLTHAKLNRWASWIIEAALSKSKTIWHEGGLRRIEAALFMVGFSFLV